LSLACLDYLLQRLGQAKHRRQEIRSDLLESFTEQPLWCGARNPGHFEQQ